MTIEQPTRPGNDEARRNFLAEVLGDPKRAVEGLVLELKSIRVLEKDGDRGGVAKAVIAMANRSEQARAWFDGCGYVLVGVEDDGTLRGRTPIDSATLTDWLTPYLGGASGPAWEPYWVAVNGTHVLFIEVPVGGLGSPIYCLHRGTSGSSEGTVFVRHPGQSRPATAADVARLARRAVAADKQVHGINLRHSGGGIFQYDWSPAEQARWLAAERNALPATVQPQGPPPTASVSPQLAQIAEEMNRLSAKMAIARDARTAADYTQEVEDYLAKCEERLPDVLPQTAPRLEPIRLTVTNNSDHMWEDLSIVLSLPDDTEAFYTDDNPRAWQRPPLPRAQVAWLRPRPTPFGKASPFAAAVGTSARGIGDYLGTLDVLPVEQRSRVTPGVNGCLLHLRPVTLVPGEARTLYLGVVLANPGSPTVNAKWAAVTPFARRQEGSLALPVNPDLLTPRSLIGD